MALLAHHLRKSSTVRRPALHSSPIWVCVSPRSCSQESGSSNVSLSCSGPR